MTTFIASPRVRATIGGSAAGSPLPATALGRPPGEQEPTWPVLTYPPTCAATYLGLVTGGAPELRARVISVADKSADRDTSGTLQLLIDERTRTACSTRDQHRARRGGPTGADRRAYKEQAGERLHDDGICSSVVEMGSAQSNRGETTRPPPCVRVVLATLTFSLIR